MLGLSAMRDRCWVRRGELSHGVDERSDDPYFVCRGKRRGSVLRYGSAPRVRYLGTMRGIRAPHMVAGVDVLQWVTDSAAALPDPLIWALGALFSFLEAGLGLGFFFPGETIVLILSAALDDPVSAVMMGAVVTVFASVGDHVGYLLGRRFGTGMRERKVIQRLGVANWDRAVGVLERRGAWAVFLTRLVPVIRTLMPAAAGVAKLRYPAFLTASLTGAATWAAVYVGCGVLLRGSLDAVQRVIGDASWILLAAAAGIGVVLIVVRLVRKRRTVANAEADGRQEVDVVTGLQLDSSDLGPVATSRPRGTIEYLTVLRIVFIGAVVFTALVEPGPAVLRSVVFGAGGLIVVVLVARWFVRPRSMGAVERVLDRLSTVGFAIGLYVAQLLPLSFLLAVIVPDLLIALFALSTRAQRSFIRPPGTDRARDLLLTAGMVIIAGASGLGLFGSVGSLSFFAGIVLGAVCAGQYGRRLFTAWAYSTRVAAAAPPL